MSLSTASRLMIPGCCKNRAQIIMLIVRFNLVETNYFFLAKGIVVPAILLLYGIRGGSTVQVWIAIQLREIVEISLIIWRRDFSFFQGAKAANSKLFKEFVTQKN